MAHNGQINIQTFPIDIRQKLKGAASSGATISEAPSEQCCFHYDIEVICELKENEF